MRLNWQPVRLNLHNFKRLFCTYLASQSFVSVVQTGHCMTSWDHPEYKCYIKMLILWTVLITAACFLLESWGFKSKNEWTDLCFRSAPKAEGVNHSQDDDVRANISSCCQWKRCAWPHSPIHKSLIFQYSLAPIVLIWIHVSASYIIFIVFTLCLFSAGFHKLLISAI